MTHVLSSRRPLHPFFTSSSSRYIYNSTEKHTHCECRIVVHASSSEGNADMYTCHSLIPRLCFTNACKKERDRGKDEGWGEPGKYYHMMVDVG